MSENTKAKTELGRLGEKLAAEYLVNLGMKVIVRNWRTGHLEIDIIAETEKEVIFIEVKTRNNDYLADPFEAVNRKKQRHLAKAAHIYMVDSNNDKSFRFDIISVIINQFGEKLEHIEDAFYPTP